MKHLFPLLLCALLLTGAASAQRRFQVGVRGGVTTTSYTFSRVEIGENRFRPGPAKAGYQAGFVLRFNLTRRLHLQSELNFAFVNYSIRAEGSRTRSVSLRSERFEIPLQLGLQFGPLRLFGGAQFRVADSERDSAPKLLKVNFNDDVGIMGGVGFNIRKFFFDFRLSGYARSMGHRMSDLDAIGSAEGVLRICKICDVPAVIAVRRDATLAGSLIDALCRAGQKDDFIDPKDALPIISKRTLCIVVDTYQVGLVESKDILEKCGKVAVIDHHRKGVGYIENPALVCHEPYSSSASELVTELLQYVGERDDKPNRVEAEGLLSGIMLDTRDFTLHTGVRTFEAAAALRRYGAETERVRQLFDVTMVEYNAKADLVEKARMYKNCAISVSGEVAPEARVAIAQAANDLLTIQGVDASFVAVQVGTGVNISARSLGAVNVQVIMESLGGGGHQTMAAAQLKHITPEAAHARIEGAIDKYYASQKKGDVEGK